ncbi:MAG: signal peptidase II [Steroidobacteraceae bacterium]
MSNEVTLKQTGLLWLWLSIIVVAADQITKWIVTNHLDLYEVLPLGPMLELTRLHNTGAAFSLLAQAGGWQRWFFVGLAGAISLAIGRWLYTLPARGYPWLTIGLAMILGGAVGNAIDRLTLGHVVDFLHFHWQDWYYPAFNVADIAITSGAIMLVIDALMHTRRSKAPPG